MMTLNFTFKKVEPTEALKQYVEKKIDKFQKYISYPMDVHAILSVDKAYHHAEITLHAEHRPLVAVAKSKNLYESIDQVVHKLEAQLKKEREKRKTRNSTHYSNQFSSLKLAKDVKADVPHTEKKRRRTATTSS